MAKRAKLATMDDNVVVGKIRNPRPLSFEMKMRCSIFNFFRERSGSVVECLTRDRRAAGSSLTGVTALCP